MQIPRMLARLTGEIKEVRREWLYVVIDDFSHTLLTYCPTSHKSPPWCLVRSYTTIPRSISRTWYTDRGTEYIGVGEYDSVAWCREHDITQHFTKPHRPRVRPSAPYTPSWKSGTEKNRFADRDDRRRSLYRFVDYCNHERKHGGLGNQAPIERLPRFANGETEEGSIPLGNGDNT